MLRGTGGLGPAAGVVPAVSGSGLPLTAAMHEDIEPRLRALRAPLAEDAPSELTFANLFLFRAVRGWRHHAQPLPHIAGRSYDGSVQLLPLFDLATADLDALRALQGEHGWFCPVATATLERLDPARFEVRAERDDADYLYAALRAYGTSGNPQVGRANAIMSGMAKPYTRAELKKIADYLGSLPGELQAVPQSKFR